MFKKILLFLRQPMLFFIFLNNRGITLLNDESYLRILYKYKTSKKLNLNNPVTFNEKLQWLKIHNRNDIYTIMVDKYEAKKYVASIIGEEFIIPTLGIYDHFNDIDFSVLPNQFVMKCTHDSGGLVICRDKSKLDLQSAKQIINKSLKNNYYNYGREWPYKNVKPRIIIEKYMQDDNYESIRDYKFFCFSGIPKIMYLSEGLEDHSTATMSFFDMDFNITSCKRKDYNLFKYKPEKPKNFEKMKDFSKILSKDIPHLRVDFYEINGHLYFGELTFFTCSGFVPFESEEWDLKMGEWIKLPTNDGRDLKNEK